MKPLWNSKLGSSSTDSDAQCGESGDNIPLGGIMVTRKLDVEHAEDASTLEAALSPSTLH